MAQILTPGFLKWDGLKFVLEESVSGGASESGILVMTGEAYSPGSNYNYWIVGSGISSPYEVTEGVEGIVGFKVGAAKQFTALSATLYNSPNGIITVSICIDTPTNVVASLDISVGNPIVSIAQNISIPAGSLVGIRLNYSESVSEISHKVVVTLS